MTTEERPGQTTEERPGQTTEERPESVWVEDSSGTPLKTVHVSEYQTYVRDMALRANREPPRQETSPAD